jgi:hypothetical protein
VAPYAAQIIELVCDLTLATRCYLLRPVKRLGVDAVALDAAIEVTTAEPPLLVALDVERLELADQVAENDGAFAGHVPDDSRVMVARHMLLSAWIPRPRSRTPLLRVHRHMSPASRPVHSAGCQIVPTGNAKRLKINLNGSLAAITAAVGGWPRLRLGCRVELPAKIGERDRCRQIISLRSRLHLGLVLSRVA